MEDLKTAPVENPENASEQLLTVSEADKENLLKAAKWQKVTALITVVSVALTFILGLVFVIASSDIAFYLSYLTELGGPTDNVEMMEDIMSVVVVVVGVICLAVLPLYIVAVVYMLRASRAAKTAVENNDTFMFQESLKNNKSLSKFLGICTIVALALIPVLFITVVIVAVALAA